MPDMYCSQTSTGPHKCCGVEYGWSVGDYALLGHDERHSIVLWCSEIFSYAEGFSAQKIIHKSETRCEYYYVRTCTTKGANLGARAHMEKCMCIN